MSRFSILFVLPLLILSIPSFSQENGQEIIEAHKAMNNPEAISAINALKWVGTEAYGVGGIQVSFELLQAPEGKWQITRVANEVTTQETYTGEQGWVSSNGSGDLELINFEVERLDPFARMAQWGSLLANAEYYGYEAEYLGLQRAGRAMLHEFRMAGKNYDGFMLYVDANTNLVVKIRDLRVVKGRQESVEVMYSDYREVEGAMLPYKIETYKAGELISIVQFETVEINPEIPAETWQKPMSNRERESKKDGARD